MTKKVIQVPVEEELLQNLDMLSKKRRKARSELIRQACWRYIKQAENDELDKIYKQGYINTPEEPETGKAQVAMLGEVLTKESW